MQESHDRGDEGGRQAAHRRRSGSISAKIKDRDIELRTAKSTLAPDDDLVTDVLLKMAKQRRESIEMYEAGGREELAEQERAELAVIEGFLPTRLDEAATRAAIAEVTRPRSAPAASRTWAG